MNTNYDGIWVRQLGRSMRFFLNASLVLMISYSLFIQLYSQQVAPIVLLLTGIPVVTAIFYFIMFLLLLKRIEICGGAKRDIEMVSRVISEYNKSRVIKLVIGKIDSFIEY